MKLYRSSGLPIEPQDADTIKTLFKTRYDELESIHGKFSEANASIFQEALQALEDECLHKYPRSRDVELTDIPDLIGEFKTAVAVSLALIEGTEQLALYLMDGGIQ